ncbi:MAG: hypothetical protein ACLVIP_02565 [Ruminococcus sp.]
MIDKLTMSKIGRELPQINNATAQSAVQAAQINVKDIFDEVNNSRKAFDENVKSSVRNMLAKSLRVTLRTAKGHCTKLCEKLLPTNVQRA